jgi:thiaminase/transcriptional activator TenA
LDDITPSATTCRYTDFLLATAWSSEVGVTIAAMTPCMRLYAWLGQQLAAGSPAANVYQDWVQTYASAEFEQLASSLERLLDHHTPANPITANAYRYAMQCEHDFFATAWQGA